MKKVRILLPALLATILLMMVLPADAMPRNLHSGMATEQHDGLTDPAQEEQQEKTIFKDALGSMHIACPRPAKVIPPRVPIQESHKPDTICNWRLGFILFCWPYGPATT